jgi:hypothetical protein
MQGCDVVMVWLWFDELLCLLLLLLLLFCGSAQVSAPPLIAWKYNVVPEAGSEEDKLLQVLRTPREWV